MGAMLGKSAFLVCWMAAFAAGHGSSASDCAYELVGDVNGDCRVDLLDMALVAQNWLVDCRERPQDPACVARVLWQLEAPMSTARYSCTGGVIDGRIYVFGGNDEEGENLKSTEMFDPSTGKWSRRADNNHAGEGVEELTSAVVDGKLYVFGGYAWSEWDFRSGTINFVEEYNPLTNSWRSCAPKPTALSMAPATVYDDEIYVFGGNYCTEFMDDPVYYRVVEAFRPSSNTWRRVTNIPTSAQLFALATIGDKAYLMGGYLPDEDRMTGEVMTFDFATGQWDRGSCRPMATDRMRAFSYATAAPMIDGRILLMGGLEGSFERGIWASNKVDVYDPATDTWRVREPLQVSMHSQLSVVVDNRIYLIGGTMHGLKTCFSAQY